MIFERKIFLDGLRGWASVAVLFWHLYYQVFYYSEQTQPALRYIPLINGVFAVHIFFIISGFALSIAMIERPDSHRLMRMACGRYFRLVIPIFAICSLVYLCMISGLVPEHYDRIPDYFLHFTPSLSHLFTFSYWNVFFNYSFEQTYVPPLWTMQYELAGSALIFFLLFMIQRSPWRMYVYTSLFLGLLVFNRTPYVYFALFVAGLMLANIWHCYESASLPLSAKILFFAGIIFGLFTPALSQNIPGWVAAIGAVSFVFCISFTSRARRFFETKISQFLGNISFSLYLVHAPLLYIFATPLFSMLEQKHLLSTGNNALLTATLTALLSFVCAVAFQPIDRFALRTSREIGKKLANLFSSNSYTPPSPE